MGEITFFKKPAKALKLEISTDKSTYAPGDDVSFEVRCINSTTGEAITDCYVSVTVTDDSVFQKLEERKQPPSFAARVYLENEVQRTENHELYYANQYIEHWWQSDAPQSNDENLELLLGVQGWRYRIFALDRLQNIYNNEI
jgi:hypothetical protein